MSCAYDRYKYWWCQWLTMTTMMLEATQASWWKLHLLCQQLAFGSHTPCTAMQCNATCLLFAALHHTLLCTAVLLCMLLQPTAVLSTRIRDAVNWCFTAFHCTACTHCMYTPCNTSLHAYYSTSTSASTRTIRWHSTWSPSQLLPPTEICKSTTLVLTSSHKCTDTVHMTLSKLLCTENCRVVYSQGWCRSGRSKTVNLFPLKRCKQRGRASPTTHSFSLLFFWPTLLSSLCSTLKETSREKQTNLRTRFLPKSFYEGFGNFIWQPEWAAETDFFTFILQCSTF